VKVYRPATPFVRTITPRSGTSGRWHGTRKLWYCLTRSGPWSRSRPRSEAL